MKSKAKRELIIILIIFSVVGYEIIKEYNSKAVVETSNPKPFFQIVNLTEEIFQEDIYNLPEEISIYKNGKSLKEQVIWDKVPETNTPGKYMYEGHTKTNDCYVNLILKVKENVYGRKVGYIRNIYMNNNEEMLIEFDTIEFYEGQEAITEAIKDNEIELNDGGNPIEPCEFYVRNTTYDKEVFKINRFPIFELIEIEANDQQRGSLNLIKVDFDFFKKYIDNYNNCDDEEKLLFSIDLKNNEVMAIVRQYLEYN